MKICVNEDKVSTHRHDYDFLCLNSINYKRVWLTSGISNRYCDYLDFMFFNYYLTADKEAYYILYSTRR